MKRHFIFHMLPLFHPLLFYFAFQTPQVAKKKHLRTHPGSYDKLIKSN